MTLFRQYLVAALAVSIALWKDATPLVRFPSTEELVKIELGRVLSCARVLKRHGFRPSPGLESCMKAEPWHVDVPALVSMYENELRSQDKDLDVIGKDLALHAHEDSYMLSPKLRSMSEADVETLVRKITRVLDTKESRVSLSVALETYESIHKRLVPRYA